jgi:branched-chain amino acid transport system substrate-binding protein
MNRTAKRGFALVAAATLLAATACSNSGGGGGGTPAVNTPGVTDTEILLAVHSPQSGPVAAGYSKIAQAEKAYFDYVNSQGGVFGRKINLKILDDAYNPATTNQVIRKAVLEDKVFAILNGLGTGPHNAVAPFLNQNKVPDLFVASGATAWNDTEKLPYTFGYQTDYTTEGKIIGNYIKTNYAGKKVCAFGQDDDFGRDSLAGVEKGLGAAVSVKQTYVTTNTNVAPAIQALQTGGCEVVALATVPGFTALTLGNMAKLAFKPVVIGSGVGGDYNTVAASLAANKGLLSAYGYMSAGYLFGVRDTANPWHVLFSKVNKDFNANATFDNNIIYGMSVAYLFVQALVKNGKELTRDGLIATIEKGGFTGPGIAPLNYAKGNHQGYSGVRLTKVTNDIQDYFGPVYQTDKKDAPVTEYTSPPSSPPANGIPTA